MYKGFLIFGIISITYVMMIIICYRIKLLISFNRKNIKKVCEELNLSFRDFLLSYQGKGMSPSGKITIKWYVFPLFRNTRIYTENREIKKIGYLKLESYNRKKSPHLAKRNDKKRLKLHIRNVKCYENIWIAMSTDPIRLRTQKLLQSKEFQETIEYFAPPSKYYLELIIINGKFSLYLSGTRRNNEINDLKKCLQLYDKILIVSK